MKSEDPSSCFALCYYKTLVLISLNLQTKELGRNVIKQLAELKSKSLSQCIYRWCKLHNYAELMFQNLTSDSFNVATNESMSSQYLYMI